MPTYVFTDANTGEQFDKFMKISEREEYLKQNPHLTPVLTAPAICDPVRVGARKLDSGFKEVLQKVNERNPNNDLAKNSTQL